MTLILTLSSVVATPAVQATIEALKAQGVDELAAQAISVEQSSQYILRLVATLLDDMQHNTDRFFIGQECNPGEHPWQVFRTRWRRITMVNQSWQGTRLQAKC